MVGHLHRTSLDRAYRGVIRDRARIVVFITDTTKKQLIERLYAAFAAGDMDTVRRCFAPDVVWHEGGVHQLRGDYLGFEGVLAINGRAAELAGTEMALDVHDILESDEHAVILQRVTATKAEVDHILDEVLVVHVSDERISEVWVSYADPLAAQELFG